MSESPERVIGGSYELIEQIGGGASGTVWRALDRHTNTHVAVKLLREDLAPQPKAVMRFVQERAILAALRHRNIVPVRDLLTVGSSLGLVMELVEGGSVRDLLRARGTLPPAEAATIMASVAEALAHAHSLGVVHRDLKPDNILLGAPSADDPQVRLSDFGIARVLDTPALTTTGALIGTPNYLAPEVVNGARPTPAADVYAFGMVLYELLVGRPPYGGHTPRTVLRRHVSHRPERFPGIPDALWKVISSCVDKAPGRRPTAPTLAADLRTLTGTLAAAPALAGPPPPVPAPLSAPVTGAAPRIPAQVRRVRGWQALTTITVGVLLVAAVATWGFLRGPGADTGGGQPGLMVAGAPTASPTASAAARASASASAPAPPAGKAVEAVRAADRAEAGGGSRRSWSALRCGEYVWKFGHPALAKPCHATGPRVRLTGYLRSAEGIRADVTLSLRDTATGRTVAGPFTCRDLVFTAEVDERSCGGFEASVPRGRSYAVVQTWRYAGKLADFPGSVTGASFRY